jgi:hypothetical protein
LFWVTRSHIHLDRVASPWLIRRFVDREAAFGFLDEGTPVPEGAVAFAIPGAALGPHDRQGSTFRKILLAHSLRAPELQRMADVVDLGIAIALGEWGPAVSADLEGFASGLAAFSEAMTILRPDDHENLRDSAPYYDALYLSLWAAYGDAPSVPPGIVPRIAAYRDAVNWASLLPAWQDPATRPVMPA